MAFSKDTLLNCLVNSESSNFEISVSEFLPINMNIAVVFKAVKVGVPLL